MNTLPIIVLTEIARAPLPATSDTAVFINPQHVATWRPAAHPKGCTEVRLAGDSELGTIFVRESPERVFELVTGEALPTLEVDDIRLPQHALSFTSERSHEDAFNPWLAQCGCGYGVRRHSETAALRSLQIHHLEPEALKEAV